MRSCWRLVVSDQNLSFTVAIESGREAMFTHAGFRYIAYDAETIHIGDEKDYPVLIEKLKEKEWRGTPVVSITLATTLTDGS